MMPMCVDGHNPGSSGSFCAAARGWIPGGAENAGATASPLLGWLGTPTLVNWLEGDRWDLKFCRLIQKEK